MKSHSLLVVFIFKIIFIIFALIIFTIVINASIMLYKNNFYLDKTDAKNLHARYAKITKDTPLFRSNDIENFETNNIYFLLPESYFVEIINSSDNVAEVNYNGITGYTACDDLLEVNFTPTNMYPNVSLKIKSDSSTYLKESPSSSSNTISIVRASYDMISYFGNINGTTPSDGTTTIWYYVMIKESETKVNFGYIYSERCEDIGKIKINTEGESNDNISIPASSSDVILSDEIDEDIYKMKPLTKWILITLLCLPVIFIFILMIRKPKKKMVFDDDDENM